MSYREHAPPPELAPWLACTWERRGSGGSPVRVLPDGCVDVVWTQGVDTQIVGANTTAFLVPLRADTQVVGARLRPGAAPALLGVPGEALRDARVPLREVWGGEGERLASTLEESPDRVVAMRDGLRARAARAERPDPMVRRAVTALARPDVAVSELAAELGLSERQLRRRFSSDVGYGPKRLARVLRLLRALEWARTGDDLGRVALEAGYADHAHFSNDCRALAGVTPSQVLAS